ncbi:Reticulocyte-binding protein 2-like protein a [Diplonema papillatum]|nr:Reticulocyte-binding protein 2-like protein a [Diplonema papillatum]|eukprot:gene6745-10341_t
MGCCGSKKKADDDEYQPQKKLPDEKELLLKALGILEQQETEARENVEIEEEDDDKEVMDEEAMDWDTLEKKETKEKEEAEQREEEEKKQEEEKLKQEEEARREEALEKLRQEEEKLQQEEEEDRLRSEQQQAEEEERRREEAEQQQREEERILLEEAERTQREEEEAAKEEEAKQRRAAEEERARIEEEEERKRIEEEAIPVNLDIVAGSKVLVKDPNTDDEDAPLLDGIVFKREGNIVSVGVVRDGKLEQFEIHAKRLVLAEGGQAKGGVKVPSRRPLPKRGSPANRRIAGRPKTTFETVGIPLSSGEVAMMRVPMGCATQVSELAEQMHSAHAQLKQQELVRTTFMTAMPLPDTPLSKAITYSPDAVTPTKGIVALSDYDPTALSPRAPPCYVCGGYGHIPHHAACCVAP